VRTDKLKEAGEYSGWTDSVMRGTYTWLFVAFVSPVACSADAVPDHLLLSQAAPTGSASLQVNLPTGNNVGLVRYTVACGSVARSGSLGLPTGDVLTATIDSLPVGDGDTVSLTAASKVGDECAGIAGPFSIRASATTPVRSVLLCSRAPRVGTVNAQGEVDVCPRLRSLLALPAEVTVGHEIPLIADAGPDEVAIGFPLSFAWTGVTSADDQGNATFLCTSAGTFSVSVEVHNGDPLCEGASADPASSTSLTVSVVCDPV
jgi:hypothetical protein